jgi:hypothetical protein
MYISPNTAADIKKAVAFLLNPKFEWIFKLLMF